jgi:hypothetical protein
MNLIEESFVCVVRFIVVINNELLFRPQHFGVRPYNPSNFLLKIIATTPRPQPLVIKQGRWS